MIRKRTTLSITKLTRKRKKYNKKATKLMTRCLGEATLNNMNSNSSLMTSNLKLIVGT